MMWALIIHLTPDDFIPAPFSCFSLGKVFIGNKKEIAESRIPELNTYMKVITFNFMHRAVFLFCANELLACLVRCSSLQLSGLNDAVGGQALTRIFQQ